MFKAFLTFALLILTSKMAQNRYQEAMKSPKVSILAISKDNKTDKTLINKLNDKIQLDEALNKYYEVIETSCGELLDFCELENIDPEVDTMIQPRYTCSRKIEENGELTLPYFYTSLSQLSEHMDRTPPGLNIVFNYPDADQKIKSKIDELIPYLEKRLIDNINSYTIVMKNTQNDNTETTLKPNTTYVVINGKYEALEFEDIIEMEPMSFVDEINRYLLKPVERLIPESLCKIYASGIQNKIYLIEKQEECKDVEDLFEKAAIHNIKYDVFKDRLQFIHAKLNDKGDIDITEVIKRHLGDDILESKTCDILILGYKRGDYLKYKLNKAPEYIAHDDLIEFVDAFNTNQLEERYIKSERPKADNQIVAKNFKEKVINSDENIFLLICERYDQSCDILIKFCEFMNGKGDSSARFYYLDSSKNDVDQVHTRVFPMFLVYKKNKKQTPEMFKVDFSYEALVDFYNQHVGEFVFGNNEKLEFLDYIKDYIPAEDRIKLESLFTSTQFITQEL